MNRDEMANEIHRSRNHCVYVVQFDSGIVKVGQTIRTKTRLWQHGNDARSRADQVTETWMSSGHTNALENERELIAFCKERWHVAFGREFFGGADFGEIVEFAQDCLTYRKVSQEEINAFDQETARLIAEYKAATAPSMPERPPVMTTVHFRKEEFAKRRIAAGITSDAALASAMGMDESHMVAILTEQQPIDMAFVLGTINAFDGVGFADLWGTAEDSNDLLAEVERFRDFQERVLAAAEQWKERGYLYESCGLAVDDLMNGGDGHV